MFKLTVLSSNSKGNGYVLQNENEALILECGCSLKDAKIALDWNIRKLVACFISHEHG